MKFIVVMLVYTTSGSSYSTLPPAVIHGFESGKVCEAAIPELRKQIYFKSAKCVTLPADAAAIKHGLSVDGNPSSK